MNLVRETRSFWAWLYAVMRAFLAIRPVSTLTVVAASGIARVTNLLAFFLPLKAILLAGSPGIPRYFPFIDPDQKVVWIVGLAAAALVSYALTLAFDFLARRLSEGASSEVIQGANELVVLDDQETVAQRYYAAFCQICANLLFVVLGAAALAVLSPWLLLVLSALVVGQYLSSAWALSGDDVNPGPMKLYLEERSGSYLQILSSANFLAGFVVLLVPFLAGAGGNILIAILAVIVLRQLLTSLTAIATDATRLVKDRHRIDALVFREARLEKPEQRTSRNLREVFSKTSRQGRGAELLSAAGVQGRVDARWQDSSNPGIKTLLLVVDGGAEGHERCFQQQIFSKGSLHQLHNEEHLFRYVPRGRLHAPEVLIRFSEGPFECQICRYGAGRTIPEKEWRAWKLNILENAWAQQPPAALLSAYVASRPLLHQRLGDELVERLAVAVDTEEEAQTLDNLCSAMPHVRERLQALPLYVYNPDLAPANTVLAGDDVLVMHWGRWSLEPLGAGRRDQSEQGRLIELLPRLRSLRSDLGTLDADDIRFAGLCQRLEFQIQGELYKGALQTAGEILSNRAISRATRVA